MKDTINNTEKHIEYTNKIQECQKSAKRYKYGAVFGTVAGMGCVIAMCANALANKEADRDTIMALFAAACICFYLGRLSSAASKDAHMLSQHYRQEMRAAQKQR